MYKKLLMIATAIVITLTLIVAPVEASPEDNWNKDGPPPPYQWDIAFLTDRPVRFECTSGGVNVYFYIDIDMPPVPFPVKYSVDVGGRPLASDRVISFEDSGEPIGFETSFSSLSIPRPLTVTLTLQAKGIEISVSETVEVPCW